MLYILLLLFLSFLPVFLLGFYIYVKDKNKEPFGLLVGLFFSGVATCFMVVITSFILELIFPIFRADVDTLNLFELLIYAFIGVALIEEFYKWLMSYIISFKSKHFDELYDIIVYCVFVSLGFAFFENVLYVLQGGVSIGIMRALLSVPGHACDAVFMGYFLGLAKLCSINGNKKLKTKNIILSILVPTLMHGFYDYCLFSGNLILIFLFFSFVVLVYIFTILRIRKTSNVKRKLKYGYNYCPKCGYKVVGNYCPKCGTKHN